MKATTPLLGLALLTGVSQAGTISWGGAQFTTNYSSDASALETGSGEVMFELGIFVNDDGTEFTPTLANAAEWNDRWVPFTSNGGALLESISDYNSTGSGLDQNYFGGNVAMGTQTDQVTSSDPSSTNSQALIYDRQAYIWGYNQKTVDNSTEWLLFTGRDGSGSTDTNWLVPDSSASNNGSFTLTWDVDNANTAVVGRLNDEMGDGDMTPPTDPFGPDDVQFALIPEPSSTMLLLLGGAVSLVRRRRN